MFDLPLTLGLPATLLADHLVFPVLAEHYGDKRASGYRDVVKVVEEEKEVTKTVEGKEVKEKKTWKLCVPFSYLSLAQLLLPLSQHSS